MRDGTTFGDLVFGAIEQYSVGANVSLKLWITISTMNGPGLSNCNKSADMAREIGFDATVIEDPEYGDLGVASCSIEREFNRSDWTVAKLSKVISLFQEFCVSTGSDFYLGLSEESSEPGKCRLIAAWDASGHARQVSGT